MLRITEIRTSRGLAALARKASLDQSLISKIEHGFAVPYPAQLVRLAAALGVPRDEAQSLLAPVQPRTEGR
jgi:transcriptional regulator with XRE-family HTH domain